MNVLEYLFAGFAVFWAALFAYIIVLQGRLRSLNGQIDVLEERLAATQRERDTPTDP